MRDELDLDTFTKHQIKWNSLLENITCTEIKTPKVGKSCFLKSLTLNETAYEVSECEKNR